MRVLFARETRLLQWSSGHIWMHLTVEPLSSPISTPSAESEPQLTKSQRMPCGVPCLRGCVCTDTQTHTHAPRRRVLTRERGLSGFFCLISSFADLLILQSCGTRVPVPQCGHSQHQTEAPVKSSAAPAHLFPPPPLCKSHALVQATAGVGTILIWCLSLMRYKCSAAT